MPIISALTLYPIKSCAGISLQTATLTEAGLSHQTLRDREWMLIDSNNQFLTQREYPRMALLQPELADEKLMLHAPDMPALEIGLIPATPGTLVQVQVWDDLVPAYDCGATAASWLTRFLGVNCRLVRSHPSSQRCANPKWTGDIKVPALFSDGYPLLLISSASLEDLNQRLLAQGRAAVPMDRFRPNIVIDGVEAFEEDYAEVLIIHKTNAAQQSIQLQPVKPCPRCPIPAVDQASAEVGPNPVDILQSYRSNPLLEGAVTFGMNTIVRQGAGQTIAVGDALELQLAF
ncbi:MOSC domain-containing protein [Undibacterium sp. Ren11W]|uniref:MOSC domain-containing protein n=1 Tax=Undibacterium sp. Ren11W TaxID=3413045 RepID=UPI003BF29C85